MYTYLQSFIKIVKGHSKSLFPGGHTYLLVQTKNARGPRDNIKLPGGTGSTKPLSIVGSLVLLLNLAAMAFAGLPTKAWAASGSTDVTLRGLPQVEEAKTLTTLPQTGISQWPYLLCLAGVTILALVAAYFFCKHIRREHE